MTFVSKSIGRTRIKELVLGWVPPRWSDPGTHFPADPQGVVCRSNLDQSVDSELAGPHGGMEMMGKSRFERVLHMETRASQQTAAGKDEGVQGALRMGSPAGYLKTTQGFTSALGEEGREGKTREEEEREE